MAEPGMPLPEMSSLAQESASEGVALRDRLDRYFELSVYLLVAVGFGMLAITGALDFPSIVGVGAALVVRGWFLLTRRTVRIPQKWDAWLSLIYLLFYVADYLALSGSFVTATVHLVLFSMVVKIFSVRRDRDYLYLAVLAFLEILAACVLTIETSFLPILIVFAILAVFTFVTFEMRRSWPRDSSLIVARVQGTSRRFVRAFAGMLLAIVLGMIVIATALFFVLPRVTAGYMGRTAPKNSIQSGFSEEVSLGKIGEIQQSNAVVMHVQFHGAPPAQELYWRGVSLSVFDGQRWLNPLPRQSAQPNYPGAYDLRWLASEYRREQPQASQRRTLLSYRVLMEPVGTNVFFLVPVAKGLEGSYRDIMTDGGGAVYNGERDQPVGMYEAVSELSTPGAARLREASGDIPSGISLRYLQHPKVDPRVTELARQITAGDGTEYDKAKGVEEYLRSHYGYTLQLPQTPPKDPIANFLFERKRGHCEYFASAMAVMMRELGIPSRVVNGFRGGEFNPVTHSYVVRERDAHSWVEVYFPGYGWETFDPTPAGATPSGTMGSFSMYLDAAREFWREWVINYDFGHQHSLSRSGVLQMFRFVDRGTAWARGQYSRLINQGLTVHKQVQRAPKRWVLALCVVSVLIALLLRLGALNRTWRERRLLAQPARQPQAASTLWYRKMAETTARRGWRKLPVQTPDEFLVTIDEAGVREAVRSFTERYHRARFAGSQSDAAELPSLYDEVEAACKAGKRER